MALTARPKHNMTDTDWNFADIFDADSMRGTGDLKVMGIYDRENERHDGLVIECEMVSPPSSRRDMSFFYDSEEYEAYKQERLARLQFKRSKAGKRRHICDWTGTVLCAAENGAQTRDETDKDSPHDEWCMICSDIARFFPSVIRGFLHHGEWPVSRAAEDRWTQVANASGPAITFGWLQPLMDLQGPHDVFIPAFKGETWESYRLRANQENP